jgi:phosphoribosylcarboxyaminoimidazole (NCAIR) mutase
VRRQDHDGHAAPVADFGDDLLAVAIGQAQVEDDQVRLAGAGFGDAFAGVLASWTMKPSAPARS